MKFGEATIEESGCDSRGRIFFERTSHLASKENCPNGNLRCCIFCSSECSKRCNMAATVMKQPERIRDRIECVYLRPSLELAWKWLESDQ